jgi:transposase
LDSGPLSLTSFGLTVGVQAPTLHRWYRDCLSDYSKDRGASVHKNDIEVHTKRGKVPIDVPIFKDDNFGPSMAIDEKQIGDDMYTIMSNRETTKIAMVCKSMRSDEIRQVIESHPNVTNTVKSISRDFSRMYAKVGREVFTQAKHVIDKFHVIFNLNSSLQDFRVFYRQKELTKKREAYNEFKEQEYLRKKEYEFEGKKFTKRQFRYKTQRLSNGDTHLELLQRSRGLLFKFKSQWTEKQSKRAMVLFEEFPKLEMAYSLSIQFRNLMDRKNIGGHYLHLDKLLNQWYEDVDDSQISEMLNFKSLIEQNQEGVMNYFIRGETNAIAETNNSKIQKFITANLGVRDKDFFFFRLGLYFA